jgi:hypothetical protein
MIYRTFIIAALLVFTYGCSDSNNDDGFDLSPVDPPVPTDVSQLVSPPEWLYVQTAATAQMTSDTTLEMPFTRDVFAFTDRPNRRHAYLTAYEFTSLWSEGEGSNSFYEEPPNAVLTWSDGEKLREVEVIINNAAVYSDGGVQDSLVYEVTLGTEQMPDAQMSSVSLFVDGDDEVCEGLGSNIQPDPTETPVLVGATSPLQNYAEAGEEVVRAWEYAKSICYENIARLLTQMNYSPQGLDAEPLQYTVQVEAGNLYVFSGFSQSSLKSCTVVSQLSEIFFPFKVTQVCAVPQ